MKEGNLLGKSPDIPDSWHKRTLLEARKDVIMERMIKSKHHRAKGTLKLER